MAFNHLRISRIQQINPRRPGHGFSGRKIKRADVKQHGQVLAQQLSQAIETAQEKSGQEDHSPVFLKVVYEGSSIDFNNFFKHGIEVVSQEDDNVCVVFVSKKGSVKLKDNLNQLDNEQLSYSDVLSAFAEISLWTKEDRKSWAIKNLGLPQTEIFRLDVEIWPLPSKNPELREQQLSSFEDWLSKNSITTIDKVNRDSLILFRLQLNLVQANLLFEHNQVRQIDLLPRTGITYPQLASQINQSPREVLSPNKTNAKVCLLDSGIISNHPLLASAIGDEQSFIKDSNPSDDVGHGTAVAGILLYGDLEECLESNNWNPELWILSGKVMRKDHENPDNAIYDDETIETTIAKAVKHFNQNYGCRVFNLSLGNLNRPYDGKHIKGLAVTLDDLAREYGVLFIVSTGNFDGDDEVPKLDWHGEYPEYLLHSSSIIIDPAPALNVITVGSVAKHTATHDEKKYPEINHLAPANENQPSPFTRHGPSVKGAIKPDVVAYGGNYAVGARREGEQRRRVERGLGVLTLNKNFMGGYLFKEVCGTSFAAPYITHIAGRLLNQYPDATNNLLRALLASQASIDPAVKEIFSDKKKHKKIKNLVGYGSLDVEHLFRSTEDKVLMLSEDSMENDTHHFYELPIPEDYFRKKLSTRKLNISLAYTPAVRSTRAEYLATKILFKVIEADNIEAACRIFHQEAKKSKIPNLKEFGNQKNKSFSITDRSKGTLQSTTWTFKRFNRRKNIYIVVTRKDCVWAQNISCEKESYAIVVTVADQENQNAKLYTQISTLLKARAEVKQQIHATA